MKAYSAIFESYSIANPRNTSVLLWVGSIATSKYDPNLLPEKTKFRIAMGIELVAKLSSAPESRSMSAPAQIAR